MAKEDRPLHAAVADYCIGAHDIGRLTFGITNFGMIGIGENKGPSIDCFTGLRISLGFYPKGGNASCFYKGGLWVGAVVGKDTLVSAGADFNNQSREFHPTAPMTRRSSLEPGPPGSVEAISELEYIAVYADTFTYGVPNRSFDPIDRRFHRPLGLEVVQRSFSWSHAHTDDFVIMEFNVRNVGNDYLDQVYLGIYWDSDLQIGGINVGTSSDPYGRKSVTGGRDDLSGFIRSVPSSENGCDVRDTLSLAWIADNDGDWVNSQGDFGVPDVVGIRLLGSYPYARVKVGFNWWTWNYNSFYDFGPQSKSDYRYLGNGSGTPYGDRNKYHLLSNGEVDYDQVYTASITQGDATWVKPSPRLSRTYSKGTDIQFLLSVGPFSLVPGAEVTLPVAFVGGEAFHQSRYNHRDRLLRTYMPHLYYAGVNFSEIIRNSATAGRVYDIPGIDTDGDGFAGKFRVCHQETLYYEGDGVPDLKAASPPPAPVSWVTPIASGLHIRFNGHLSETTPDVFSQLVDFEGYRVYISRDDREDSYAMLASLDRENYDKWTFTHEEDDLPRFQLLDEPYTLNELRCLYAGGEDPCQNESFDPLRFSSHSPYVHPNFPESVFYFTAHEFNQSIPGVSSQIRKTYPDQPAPPEDEEEIGPDDLTEDGYLKYYEYEFDIEDLLPQLQYYVTVTAFDQGSPKTGLQSLESNRSRYAKTAYPNNAWDFKPDEVGNVYVFPNPYRQDAWYRQRGLEGRGQEIRSRDRVRKVTFANLPAKCTISIFSLDGDLIRSIDHDCDPSDPNSSYHEWDLVTRNVQMIVSGIYYWVVEDHKGGTQIGKLVVLM